MKKEKDKKTIKKIQIMKERQKEMMKIKRLGN